MDFSSDKSSPPKSADSMPLLSTDKSAFAKLKNSFELPPEPPTTKKRKVEGGPPPGRPPRATGKFWSFSEQQYVPFEPDQAPGNERDERDECDSSAQMERMRRTGASPFQAQWAKVPPSLTCKKISPGEPCPRIEDCPGCMVCARLFCSLCIQRGKTSTFVTGCDGFHQNFITAHRNKGA